MDRAKLLIVEMDAICEVCSTIKNSIAQKDGENPDEEEEEASGPKAISNEPYIPDLEGHKITLMDKNNSYEYFTVKVVHKSKVNIKNAMGNALLSQF